MPANIFVALGSNLETPRHQVEKAMKRVDAVKGVSVLARSSLYISQPQGPQDQDEFVNAAIEIRTELSPVELLSTLQAIEHEFGRVKTRHWGERIIDLDIAFYGQEHVALASPSLVIPHPRAIQRDFVLKPILEISPDFVHPNGTPLAQYLASCENFCSTIIQWPA